MQPRRFTRSEAGAYLGMGREGIRHLEEKGVLRGERNERGWRVYSTEELDHVKAARPVRAPSAAAVDRDRRNAERAAERERARCRQDEEQRFMEEWEAERRRWDQEDEAQRLSAVAAQEAERSALLELERRTLDWRQVRAQLGISRTELRQLERAGILREVERDRYDPDQVAGVRRAQEEAAERLAASASPAQADHLTDIAIDLLRAITT